MQAQIQQTVEQYLDEAFALAKDLYEHPELGGQEFRSSAALCDAFERHGFTVERAFSGIPTAFRAVRDSGVPGPVIGLCAEYDALPDVGHGCGHNLICTSAFLAALALASALGKTGGRVEVYGTPAEETTGAKVPLTEAGVFDHLSVVMMAHPSPLSEKSGTSACLLPRRYTFHGKAAHAAACPQEGINALNAVIEMFNGINAMRQHVPRDVQFHGIISNGGSAANVVPDLAQACFYIRAAKLSTARMAVERVDHIAQGAALMTGATVDMESYEVDYYDLQTNQALCQAFIAHQQAMGDVLSPQIHDHGSLDLGNVSHAAPCVHGWFGFGDPTLVPHTLAFAQRTVTEDGRQLLRRAACTMALTGYDVLTQPQLLAEIRREFEAQS